jgi:hypothetical protein
MELTTPHLYYQQRIEQLSAEHAALKKRHAWLGWARLLVAALEIFFIYRAWHESPLLLVVVSILLVAIFLMLVSKALNVDTAVKNTSSLIDLNKKELEILAGDYSGLNDGLPYMEELKVPDNDLDLFGKASLFQYTNRGKGYFSQLSLAKSFVESTTPQQIELKQQAVKELMEKMKWCQQLQAYSNTHPISRETSVAINEWLHDKSEQFDSGTWQMLRFAVPLFSFTVLALYLTDIIGDGLFNTLLLLVLAFVFSFYKKISIAYNHLAQRIPELNALLPALQYIENEKFEAPTLNELQGQLLHPQKSSVAIGELKGILKRLDYRLNPLVYIPLSIFLFWDLQQVLALRRWKKRQTTNLDHWFHTVGEFEKLSSLAVLAFNNPDWHFPEITSTWFEFKCKQAGHPLLAGNKAVLNDFSMQGVPCIALITGSNMAGKSTFLRTIGANMVLGMCGAPVHAKSFKMPVMRIISSMRITDNLEEGTSTFYAELKKMKRIVEAANAGEKVFILIDEMLRGTNTIDRHTGSMALVKQLVRHNAVAMIASHDLALAALHNDYPVIITNYHFDSTIIDNEIVFDYKLKEGVCQSTNASLLMKKIGIELGD